MRISRPAELAHLDGFLRDALAPLGPASAEAGEIVIANRTEGEREADEAYSLTITPRRIVLRGATDAGVFRGLQTLLQLIEANTRPDGARAAGGGRAAICELPCLEIDDAPVFAWRGIMLDVARHFLTVAEIKDVLDRLARLKLNVFHWHLTDDQGWRIEIKKRPELTRIGAVRAESPLPGDPALMDGVPYGPFFYTQEEIREVVEHARARCITVVPEIDLPGHMRAALACYPGLGCTGGPYEVRTTWGIEEDVLCLGNPETMDFVRDVLEEICRLFPGPFVHIGGDEVPHERWMKCPCCLAAAKKAGLENPKLLQRPFTSAVETFLAARGKRAVGWDEILDENPRADTVVASWRGVAGGIKAAERGNDAIMCPASHCYLDYRDTDAPGQTVGAPNGQVISLEKCYSYEPRDSSLTPDQASRIIGVQGNVWSEYMWSAEDVRRMLFPRACAIAEIGWTPSSKKNFPSFVSRLAALGLAADSPERHLHPHDIPNEQRIR